MEQDRTSALFLHQPKLARQTLRSFETIVSLIAATTTTTGLKVHAELNTETYPAGIKVSDQELAQIKIRRDKFHGDWNYEIQPRAQLLIRLFLDRPLQKFLWRT